MTYKLDPEKKSFSYTREELFSCICRIIAHPHSVVTSHDQSRALAVMVVFEDYFSNFTESDNNGSHYVYERDELDFQDFVRFKLGIDDYDAVDVDEFLK
jgi:hypothetical protein